VIESLKFRWRKLSERVITESALLEAEHFAVVLAGMNPLWLSLTTMHIEYLGDLCSKLPPHRGAQKQAAATNLNRQSADHWTRASITSCELLRHPRIVPAMLRFISRHPLLPGSVREISKHDIDQLVGALILGNDLPRDVWCFPATIFRANRKLRLSFAPQSHQKNRLRHDYWHFAKPGWLQTRLLYPTAEMPL
jgi:hypothetical protein